MAARDFDMGIIGGGAGSLLAPGIFSDTVRRGLHFIFDYKGRSCTPGK